MKAIKYLNTFAIGVPIILILLAPFDGEILFYSMFSMVLTGALQTILAIAFWIKNKNNFFIRIYFLLSIAFFLIFYVFNNFRLDDVFSFQFWAMPILLALYLSLIIYTWKEKSETNLPH